MNIVRSALGVLFLVAGLIVFYFMPAYSITSDGVEEIHYVNIAGGVALSVVGIFFLVTGLKSRKVTLKFDNE
ncbi:MAG: hypothetical protein ACOCSC_00460 [Candidatus Hadarchaeota archaeon]